MSLLDTILSPWAITPEYLREITDIYSTHVRGEKIDIKGIEAKIGRPLNNEPQGYEIVNNVAVVPLQGVMAKKMNLFQQVSGGVSTQLFIKDFQEAYNDPEAASVIIYGDTPGGTVDGTQDAADVVFEYANRSEKPVVTVANGVLASAGYWVGSASNQIYVENGTTTVGSIGVVATHADYSKYYKERGVTMTEIYSGKYKRIVSEYKPLSKEGRNVMQERSDYLYSIFVDNVARNLGVEVSVVLDQMADGRTFIGQQAIDAGLVHGIAPLSVLINALSNGELPSLGTGAVHKTEYPEIIKQEDLSMEITKGNVLEFAPEVAEQFREEGRQSVDADALATGAAKAERERIQSVFSQSMPGHESLIQTLAFDGKTTGPEAAVQILQAEKGKSDQVKKDIEEDAKDLSGVQPSSEVSSLDHLSEDEKAEREFNQDKALQAEFKTVSRYKAYKSLEAKN